MRYYRKIAGEKVYLSPMNADDAEQYTEWLNRHDVTDNVGNTDLMMTLEGERAWISQERDQYQFAIVEQSSNRLLGNCGIQNINWRRRCAEIGLFLGEEESRGKGYGREVLELLQEYAFDVLNLHSLSLRVYSFNTRAIKCYEKAGFSHCGRLREAYYINGMYHDMLFMDILKGEWQKKQEKR